MPKIFISYRRDHAAATRTIYDRLVQALGRENIFYDVDSIPPGVNFKKYLKEKITASEMVYAIINKGWGEAKDKNGGRRLDNPKDYMRIELEAAFQQEIPVIPILVSGAEMPEEEDLPEGLQDLTYINAMELSFGKNFGSQMNAIISFATGESAVEPNAQAAPPPVEAPVETSVPEDLFAEQMAQAGRMNKLHNIDGAIEVYRRIVAEQPTHHEARGRLALLLTETAQYGDAEALCNEGLALGSSAWVHIAMASLKAEDMEIRSAFSHAYKAVELEPQHVEAWIMLGDIAEWEGDSGEERRALETGLAIDPNHPVLQMKRVLEGEHGPQKSLELVRPIIRRHSDSRDSLFYYVIALLSNDAWESAIIETERLLALNPRFHWAAGIRSFLALIVADMESCERYYNEALALNPKSLFALLARLGVLAAQEDERAYSEMETLKGYAARHNLCALMLAQFLQGAELYGEVQTVLQKRLKLHPNHAGLLIAQAELQEALGNIPFAHQCLQKARKAEPSRYDLNLVEARILIKLGEYAQASSLLEKLEESNLVDELRTELLEVDNLENGLQLWGEHVRRYPEAGRGWRILLELSIQRNDMTYMGLLLDEVEIDPFVHAAVISLAWVNQGNTEEATSSANTALEQGPTSGGEWACVYLARSLYDLGRPDEAQAALSGLEEDTSLSAWDQQKMQECQTALQSDKEINSDGVPSAEFGRLWAEHFQRFPEAGYSFGRLLYYSFWTDDFQYLPMILEQEPDQFACNVVNALACVRLCEYTNARDFMQAAMDAPEPGEENRWYVDYAVEAVQHSQLKGYRDWAHTLAQQWERFGTLTQ